MCTSYCAQSSPLSAAETVELVIETDTICVCCSVGLLQSASHELTSCLGLTLFRIGHLTVSRDTVALCGLAST